MLLSHSQTGDKIKVVSRVDADWVVGELRGKKGMFPVNFIDKVPENLPKDSDEKSSEAPTQSSKGQSAKTPAAKQVII